MGLSEYNEVLMSAIEAELKHQVARLDEPLTIAFHEMLSYHMGWTGIRGEQPPTGKLIRPLILLLVTAATGHEWQQAVPAAAAVEIVHNFSLIHDDIQDNSAERRGRPAAWKRYGVPMAINVGDALFALANMAVSDLSGDYSAEIVLRASTILHNACFALTRGQFLDMSYQKKADLSVGEYWPMVEGKTSALISACTEIGAILGKANNTLVEKYQTFGHDLGLAFQIQDDILGIWGDETLTGKSTSGDLLEGKNSLPILYGLSQKAKFAERWTAAPIRPNEVKAIADLLREEGAYEYAKGEAERLTVQALKTLEQASPQGQPGEALVALANKLLKRRS